MGCSQKMCIKKHDSFCKNQNDRFVHFDSSCTKPMMLKIRHNMRPVLDWSNSQHSSRLCPRSTFWKIAGPMRWLTLMATQTTTLLTPPRFLSVILAPAYCSCIYARFVIACSHHLNLQETCFHQWRGQCQYHGRQLIWFCAHCRWLKQCWRVRIGCWAGHLHCRPPMSPSWIVWGLSGLPYVPAVFLAVLETVR